MATKICNKCNELKDVKLFYYHRSRKVYMGSCRACNSKACVKYQRKGYRNGEKFVFYQRAYEIMRRCKTKENQIPCMENLKNYINDLWSKSKLCAYTGVEMSINGYHNNPLAMTVDRKIPELGYVEGNVVLCCSMANRMKQNLKPDELINWCKLIIDHMTNSSCTNDGIAIN
jgi:hypothetical protein